MCIGTISIASSGNTCWFAWRIWMLSFTLSIAEIIFNLQIAVNTFFCSLIHYIATRWHAIELQSLLNAVRKCQPKVCCSCFAEFFPYYISFCLLLLSSYHSNNFSRIINASLLWMPQLFQSTLHGATLLKLILDIAFL